MFNKKLLYTVVSMLAVIGSLRAQNEGYSVGTPQGSLSVSEMGAAVYNLNIEVPNGGPLTPQIGIAYNSQMSGYGLAGYGMNITGISCITRGGKDLFHDGELKGVTYTEFDNYYLDGKRLILEAGVQGKDGSKYSLEGDPYTNVYLHSKMEAIKVYVYEPETVDKQGRKTMEGYYQQEIEVETTYFEVKSSSGIITQYGNTHDSRFVLRNENGFPEKTIAWYINQVKDSLSNKIEYCYYDRENVSFSGSNGTPVYSDNLVVRPRSISYALNDKKSREITNTINFEYKSLGDNARPIVIAGRTGKMDVCLASITTKTNNDVYRKYTLKYEESIDNSFSKWTRLTEVYEENGRQETMKPVKFNWKFLSSYIDQISYSFTPSNSENDYINHLAGDLNGDGISDIIRLSSKTFGNNSFKSPYIEIFESLGPNQHNRNCKYGHFRNDDVNNCLSPFVLDYDNNGCQDIILPIQKDKEIKFNVISGSKIINSFTSDYSENTPINYSRTINLRLNTSKVPFIIPIDYDGDGKDEIICLEKEKSNNSYAIHFLNNIEDRHNYVYTSEERINNITLQNKPVSVSVGNFNNDELLDLIIFYDGGYKILKNKGGDYPYHDNFAIEGIDYGGKRQRFLGDFNGDGLTDYVYMSSYDFIFCINDGSSFTHQSVYVRTLNDDWNNSPHLSGRDNDPGSIIAYDADHDGKTDIMYISNRYYIQN